MHVCHRREALLLRLGYLDQRSWNCARVTACWCCGSGVRLRILLRCGMSAFVSRVLLLDDIILSHVCVDRPWTYVSTSARHLVVPWQKFITLEARAHPGICTSSTNLDTVAWEHVSSRQEVRSSVRLCIESIAKASTLAGSDSEQQPSCTALCISLRDNKRPGTQPRESVLIS